MANALNRNIAKGEVVVLKKEIFLPEYQALENRLFRVTGGFGMLAETTGTAIYGQYLDTEGEDVREHSFDIDKQETEEYQQRGLKWQEREL